MLWELALGELVWANLHIGQKIIVSQLLLQLGAKKFICGDNRNQNS